MKEERIKHPFYREPFSYVHLLFYLEILLVVIVFIWEGRFFFLENSNDAIVIALGLLTFNSVFFGFITNGLQDFLATNKKLKTDYKINLDGQLENKIESGLVNEKNLKDYKNFKKDGKYFFWLVDHYLLWFFLSIFLSLISLLFYLSDLDKSKLILSVSTHLAILSTLFLITSFMALYASKIKYNL